MKNKNVIIMIIVLRATLTLLVEMDILSRSYLSDSEKFLFAAGILLLQANDFLRFSSHLLSRNRILYGLSMSTTIIGIGLYMFYFNSSATSVYFVFSVVEMFLNSGAFPVIMLAIHVFVYVCTLVALHIGWKEGLFPYIAMLLVVYLLRQIHLEKDKGQRLNNQLRESNARLLNYSEQLKDMTIMKERTRIAQELHDAIGHGLVALRMNLEFVENTFDSNPNKSKEAVQRALDLSKKSIRMTGRLTCELLFDQSVEKATANIKSAIYKSIREAVTNGIKHGRPQTIKIEVTRHDLFILVVVKDDGEGSGPIKKSHGLRGIEKRIEELKGTVRFYTEENQGFTVIAKIPYLTSVEVI